MLLDLVMPEMDGFQVLSQLRNSRWFQQIPIVLITAENSESTALKGYTSGVSDIINKPFNPEIVHRRVENIIELYNHKRIFGNEASRAIPAFGEAGGKAEKKLIPL